MRIPFAPEEGWLTLALVAFIAVAALVSFFWTPFDLLNLDYQHRSAAPGVNGHWLGTEPSQLIEGQS